MTKMITIAEKLDRNGKVFLRYYLRKDEKGYYWEGTTGKANEESWRRKTRKSAEDRMIKAKFSVFDVEVETKY